MRLSGDRRRCAKMSDPPLQEFLGCHLCRAVCNKNCLWPPIDTGDQVYIAIGRLKWANQVDMNLSKWASVVGKVYAL